MLLRIWTLHLDRAMTSGIATRKMQTIYKSVPEEYTDPVPADISGCIPDWVDGSLYRNGPGMYQVGDSHYNHLFDGLAKLHKYKLKNGGVTYQSRFLQSDTYKRNMKANRIVVSEFGTTALPDPCQTIYEKISSFFKPQMTDNNVVNIYRYADQLFAVTEGEFLRKVDPETLESGAKVKAMDLMAVNMATAHPHFSPDGCLYNLGLKTGGGKVQHCVVKMTPPTPETKDKCPDGKHEIIGAIKASRALHPSYFHSFAMTENFIVLVEQPLTMNVMALIKSQMSKKAPDGAFEWDPKVPTRFHIIDRGTGKIVNEKIKYTANAFMTFHHGNAYEDNGHIVMDLSAFDDGRIIREMYMKDLASENVADYVAALPAAYLRRFVIPLDVQNKELDTNLVSVMMSKCTAKLTAKDTVLCTYEQLSDSSLEFPRINYDFNGLRYRYCYGMGVVDKGVHKLLKVDTEKQETVSWGEDDCFPGEPVFVGNPDGASENDGVVLSCVLTATEGKKPFLIVLDAKTFKEIARANINAKVANTFHGDFYKGM